MATERDNTSNQPNQRRDRSGSGTATQTPPAPTPTQPGRDRYAEDAPDSSRQYGEMGNCSKSGQGGSTGTPTTQTPQGESEVKDESCGTDACTPETGVNKTLRQPETGKRNSVSGGRRDDESGAA